MIISLANDSPGQILMPPPSYGLDVNVREGLAKIGPPKVLQQEFPVRIDMQN